MAEETGTARTRVGEAGAPERPSRRRPAPRAGASAAEAPEIIARREVVVQGMRITLPALRFMETPPPGSRSR